MNFIGKESLLLLTWPKAGMAEEVSEIFYKKEIRVKNIEVHRASKRFMF